MKKTIQLLMLLVAIPFLTQTLYGQCDQDIIITNSSEYIYDYCSNDSCRDIIGGDLIINSDEIYDFECFSSLNVVRGDLIVDGTSIGGGGLVDLAHLDSIGGDFRIINNSSAIFNLNAQLNLDFNEFALNYIGGSLVIENNDESEYIRGFANVDYIGGDLIVRNNWQLIDCCELACLKAVTQGNVIVENNGSAYESDACNFIEDIVCGECPRFCLDDITLQSQMEVDSFWVNHTCVVLQGNLLITGDDINDLSMLSELESIMGTLTIDNCGDLTTLEVSQNATLNNVTISNNGDLTLLELPLMEGNLLIQNNENLADCCNILCSSENITINDNADGCNSLGEVETICPDPLCTDVFDIVGEISSELGEGLLGRDAVVTTDGDVVVVGNISPNEPDNQEYDFLVMKVDSEGNQIWIKNYGGSDSEQAYAIDQTNDGGFIVVGNAESSNGDVSENKGQYDGWVIKLDENGDLLWEKSFGGTQSDYFRDVQQTADGGYIIAGYTQSINGDVPENQGGSDYFIIKLDEAGNTTWIQTFGSSSSDYANAIEQTSDGNYIIAGRNAAADGDVSENQGSNDIWIVKLNELGDLLWEKSFGGTNVDRAYDIKEITDGGFIVTGYTSSADGDITDNQGEYDCFVLKLDEEGNEIWLETFGGTEGDYGYGIIETISGEYLMVGIALSLDGIVGNHQAKERIWVARISETGEFLGDKHLEGESASTIVENNGKYIVVGFKESPGDDDLVLTTISFIWSANIHLCLEGAYDPATGRMKTNLADQNILPLTQPYNVPPYNYNGTESVDSTIGFPENTVDWILLEARSGTPNVSGEVGTEVVETIAALLLVDGSIVRPDGSDAYFRNLEEGVNYHIAIRHRNHLDIISQEAIEADSRMTYYFTLSQDQAFGTSQQKVLEDGKVVMYTGDYSQDGIIQVTDYDLWKEAPAQNNVYGNTDGTIDGIIQVTDYDAWLPNKAKIGNIEIQY